VIDAGSSRRLGDGSDIEIEERSRAVDKGRERLLEEVEDYTSVRVADWKQRRVGFESAGVRISRMVVSANLEPW
jgi:hypothetical protein